MFKRIKAFLESMAYAGLKPTSPGPARQDAKAASGFRQKLEAFLAGPATNDPLYLTNRTLWQKIRPILVVSLPILVLLGGLALGLANFFGLNKGIQTPPASISSAEIAKKMIPVLNQQLTVSKEHDAQAGGVDIQDVTIPPGSMKVQGVAKNLTDHEIHHVQVIFDLTDKAGSRQGAVSTEVENIASKSAKPFVFSIPQKAAAFALVREVQVD